MAAKIINTAFVIGAILMMLVGPAILAYQALRWLETAVWLHFNLWSLMPAPTTRWLGAQRIINWFWSLPLSILSPVFGALVLFTILAETKEDEFKDKSRR